MSKFFDDNQENEKEQEEVKKISLGESEFTEEELEELVGKAEKISEFEKKQGQSWDKVVESWGKRGERIGEYKKKLEEYEKAEEQRKQQQLSGKDFTELTPEERAEAIKKEAKQYGFVLKDEFETEATQLYNKLRQGEKILSKVNKTIKENVKKGYPKTTEEDLLKYMNDPSNPADPEKAYKLMFEKEIDEVNSKKLDSIKKPGMRTEEKSTAGSKKFEPAKVSKENLTNVLRDHFKGGGE